MYKPNEICINCLSTTATGPDLVICKTINVTCYYFVKFDSNMACIIIA